jgi:cytochrome c-type biogenesis protein CcmH/NrfG
LGALLIETGDYEAAVLTLQSALQAAKPDVPWRADARATPDMERARALGATGVLRSPRK